MRRNDFGVHGLMRCRRDSAGGWCCKTKVSVMLYDQTGIASFGVMDLSKSKRFGRRKAIGIHCKISQYANLVAASCPWIPANSKFMIAGG